MDLMEIRHRILSGFEPTIGGLPILIDNAYLPRYNGPLTDYVENPNYFITGWFDTGNTSIKQYRWFRKGGIDVPYVSIRFFDSIAGTSKAAWASGMSDEEDMVVEQGINGRFIAASILKEDADKFFMHIKGTKRYVFRGKNADL